MVLFKFDIGEGRKGFKTVYKGIQLSIIAIMFKYIFSYIQVEHNWHDIYAYEEYCT